MVVVVLAAAAAAVVAVPRGTISSLDSLTTAIVYYAQPVQLQPTAAIRNANVTASSIMDMTLTFPQV